MEEGTETGVRGTPLDVGAGCQTPPGARFPAVMSLSLSLRRLPSSACLAALSALLVLFILAGCSGAPLTGAAVPGSTHGGWGAPRPAATETSERAPAGEVAAADHEEAAADSEPTPVSRPPSHAPPPSEPAPVTERQPAVEERTSAAVSRITRVSFAERSDGRGYVVRLHTTGAVPAWSAENVDGRVQLTLFQTELASNLRRARTPGPISHYQFHSHSGRTVLQLDLDADVFVEPRAYPDRDSNDLLLSLTYAPRPAPVAVATTPAAPSPGPAPPAGNGASPDAASQEHWRLDCVVIDAGHGGRDPGAVNPRVGVRESDVTLGIALKLGRYVEENLGLRVVYTRRDDRFVELAERGRIANQSCGKLFVSIHANSASNRNATGTETYFLGLHRTESARRVMERENAVIALESDPSLYSGMDEAALIMQTMAQSTYLRVSEQLAALIENKFVNNARRQSRGVKQAGFLVLWAASMPAVLIETGFISNDDEARFLKSEHGQDLIAQSIYRAIREYKEQYERGLTAAAPLR